jgi:hypothetical protein
MLLTQVMSEARPLFGPVTEGAKDTSLTLVVGMGRLQYVEPQLGLRDDRFLGVRELHRSRV